MSDDVEEQSSPAGNSTEEEQILREQVQNRLESEHLKLHGRSLTPPSNSQVDRLSRAERLHIIREEEDTFYAKQGLYRYLNHRGQYEWLTKEDIERKRSSRRMQRSSSRRESRLGVRRTLGKGRLANLLSWLTVLSLLVVAVLIYAHARIAAPDYTIDVHSAPVGAAIFVNGEAIDQSTNTRISVDTFGTYAITVVRPGYRVVPPSKTVEVVKGTPQIVVFTLCRLRSDTEQETTSP